MNQLSPKRRDFFVHHGRQGARVRSLRLSSFERSAIASRAAHVRWANKGEKEAHPKQYESIRLDKPRWDDPVYLEEVLSEGSLEDWRQVYHMISDFPFGRVAEALSKVLKAAPIYGVTPLWKDILNFLRNAPS